MLGNISIHLVLCGRVGRRFVSTGDRRHRFFSPLLIWNMLKAALRFESLGSLGWCWCIYTRHVFLGSVCKAATRAPGTAHLCPSHSTPISGHLRPVWQTLTLSAESHIPGAGRLCLMNFLGKERRGYLGGHPNVSDIHQTSLQRKRLKLENGKR